jgi:hypothetical protein
VSFVAHHIQTGEAGSACSEEASGQDNGRTDGDSKGRDTGGAVECAWDSVGSRAVARSRRVVCSPVLELEHECSQVRS